jgi:hypothetical protein
MEKEHDEIMYELNEIKTALLGSFTEKGLISRITTLEKIVATVGGVSLTALTAVIINTITSL